MTTTPEQQPDQGPPSPMALVREELRRARYRYRRQSLPLMAIGGTHVAGGMASTMTGAVTMLPLGAGVGLAAGGYVYAHRHTTSRWQRAHAAVCAACSAGWQTAAAAGVDGPLMVGALWAGGALLALPWWWRNAEPDPDVTAEHAGLVEPPPPPRPEPPTEGPDQRAVIWGKHLAAKGKALPGSQLTNIADFDHGWKATVKLPAEHHWHEIAAAVKQIASVYDLPDGRVFPESLPGMTVRHAQLTVLTDDPLQTVRRWQGPGLDVTEGTCPLMTTADGQTLPFRFWWPGEGAAHALISGITRSGKSAILDLLVAEGNASDRIEPWIIDGGGTSKWLNKLERAAATPAQARELLDYALRRMEARRPLLRHGEASSLDPTPKTPLISIVVDEAHKLLMSDEDTDNSDIRRDCEKLAQEGSKFCIQLILATQVPSAVQLGGSTVLRDQVKSGTVIGLRVGEATTENMITSGAPMPERLSHLPRTFPDGTPTRGLGYMLTGRMIRARSLLIEHPARQPVTPTRLSEAEAAVPAPDLSGTDQLRPRVAQPAGDGDEHRLVAQALADGAPTDIAALMRATGLSMGAVRRALANRN